MLRCEEVRWNRCSCGVSSALLSPGGQRSLPTMLLVIKRKFVFTSNGKASVQVMYRNVQTGSSYVQGGYEASYGSYRIDDSSTFTFHIDGALVRTLIGKDLKRVYELSGNRLTVKSTDPNEHWKVVWDTI